MLSNWVIAIVAIAGPFFIKKRWAWVFDTRRKIMNISFDQYCELPSPDRMFWQLWRWSHHKYLKAEK